MSLRYPLVLAERDSPFIMFTSHRAKYTPGAFSEVKKNDSGSCAMYMPPGFQVSDVMRYESASAGLIGGIVENVMNDNSDYSTEDVINVASTGAAAAVQGIAGLIGAALGKAGGGAISAVVAGGAATATEAIRAKKMQNMTNPQEFMLFKAPGVRAFSFTFNMIPRSATEALEVQEIIKFFRTKMYPTLGAKDLMYNFPEVFNINFKNIEGIPKIAEAALSNASTTFNPNSMSYFKHTNTPVEIALTLSFQELMPLSQKNITDGF